MNLIEARRLMGVNESLEVTPDEWIDLRNEMEAILKAKGDPTVFTYLHIQRTHFVAFGRPIYRTDLR